MQPGWNVVDATIEGARLLLVEDEFLLALCLSDLLEDLGAQVLGPVACVADALEVIDRAPEIDAAILDVNLGGEVVFPVADRLRMRNVPFAFASGFDPELLPARFRDVALCRKPIDEAAMRAALATLRQAA